MFVGVDHGTTGIRFASTTGERFELDRHTAGRLTEAEIRNRVAQGLNISLGDVDLFGLTYSMGDAISRVTDSQLVPNRGIVTRKGAGLHVGGGTRVYDAFSGLPSIVIPGIHQNVGDRRMQVFSHQASPEKVGIAYHAYRQGHRDYVISDISSNTVTLGVTGGQLIGAIDAAIFAPGVHHGPLDLQMIREVDDGKMSANEAFSHGGVIKNTGLRSVEDVLRGDSDEARLALDTITLFAAMEIAAVRVLLGDYDVGGEVFTAGSVGTDPRVIEGLEELLDCEVSPLGEWSAALGVAEIAEDVYNGAGEILGIGVNYSQR